MISEVKNSYLIYIYHLSTYLVLAGLVAGVFAYSTARRLLDHRLMAQMTRSGLAQLLRPKHVTLRFKVALDEQVYRLADAQWLAPPGLSACAT